MLVFLVCAPPGVDESLRVLVRAHLQYKYTNAVCDLYQDTRVSDQGIFDKFTADFLMLNLEGSDQGSDPEMAQKIGSLIPKSNSNLQN